MHKKELLKYIKNELDSVEKRKTIEWVRQNPENHKKFNIIKAEYVASNFKDVKSHKNIDLFFERLIKGIKKRRLDKLIYLTASLVIMFSFLWDYENLNSLSNSTSPDNPIEINGTDNTISLTTLRGDKKEVYLPDGSKITLNADSELTYPIEFNDSLREVTLIGEAFFDIKSNVNKPFIVHTNKIKVKVLGTSFNVKSYADDENIETTLVTGKVELIKDKETPIILAPSQKAVFHKKENTLEIEEVHSEDIVAWKTGKLIFKKTSLQEVVVDLERKYNVKININSLKLLDYEYTGTFDNLSIDEVLNLLTISSPIKYTIENEKINLE